jgi:UDP-4-amino-4,6-dideoxy-N-acetyl-beta-L-altrosamine N-acetyltransferase
MADIELRPFEEEDLPQVLAWANSSFVRCAVGTIRPISMFEHRRWYERIQQDPTRLTLTIWSKQEDKKVGLIGLSSIDRNYRSCEIWLYLGEAKFQGKGIGRAAVQTMVEMTFNTLGLHRVTAQVFSYNETACKFFMACGFREEGRLREAAFKSGEFCDKRVFGLLESELQRCS